MPELHAAVDGARHHHQHLRRQQEELNTGLGWNHKAAMMSTPWLMKRATFTSTCVGVIERVHMDLKRTGFEVAGIQWSCPRTIISHRA